MKRYLVFIGLAQVALALIIQAPLFAQSSLDAEAMAASNQLYESGRYDHAAQSYRHLIDQGYRDTALFFNLGNAYYKAGDLGRAILNYLRAERLSPRDPDIRANLEVARNQTVDVFESSDESPLAPMFTTAHSWLTLNELALITLVLWVTLVLLLSLYLFSGVVRLRRIARNAAVVVALLLAVGAAALGTRMYGTTTEQQAVVVVADVVNVVSGPGSQYVTEFALHSGAEASLIEQRGNWVRLALLDGQLQGWVPASAVEQVTLEPP